MRALVEVLLDSERRRRLYLTSPEFRVGVDVLVATGVSGDALRAGVDALEARADELDAEHRKAVRWKFDRPEPIPSEITEAISRITAELVEGLYEKIAEAGLDPSDYVITFDSSPLLEGNMSTIAATAERKPER